MSYAKRQRRLPVTEQALHACIGRGTAGPAKRLDNLINHPCPDDGHCPGHGLRTAPPNWRPPPDPACQRHNKVTRHRATGPRAFRAVPPMPPEQREPGPRRRSHAIGKAASNPTRYPRWLTTESNQPSVNFVIRRLPAEYFARFFAEVSPP